MKQILLTIVAFAVALTLQAQTTVPADAVVEQWVATFVMHTNTGSGDQTETVSERIDVAFSGQDVYFNLPNPIAGNTWVKGTINGTQADFGHTQVLGSYGGASVYLVGQNEAGLCNVLFDYDAERGLFTQGEMNIVLSASSTSIDAWAYYTGMTVSKSGEVQQEDGTVAPPADAIVETWTMTGRNVNPNNESQYEDLNETVQVAFSGSDIYIQGLCPASGWLKGEISGSTATFAMRQYLGKAEGYQFYAIGFEGEGAIDIVFNYNAEQGVLTTDSYVLLINEADVALMLFTDVVLTRSGSTPAEDPVVEAPAGLQTSEYVVKATSVEYNADGSVAGMTPQQWNVRLGRQGSDVYLQGLFEGMPLAWVKGTLDDDELTLKQGQYYGSHPQLKSMKFYFAGMYFGELADMVMQYDRATDTYAGGSYYMLVNSSKTELAPYNVYVGVTITRVADVAATPATPVIDDCQPFNAEYGYGYASFTLPATDTEGNAINRDKMSYRVYYEQDGQQQVYTFSSSQYHGLEADSDAIPYFFADGYDFYMGGTFVAFYEEMLSWKKIGVQTVYTGGGQTNASQVAWCSIDGAQGIDNTPRTAAGSTTYTDLQGRRVAHPGKGLYIVDGKKVVLK
ncbi:MAG: hypothetical protein IJV24_06110 [Prevotella sp.]|nr:hypothetical protein [Prevotella sp.]